MNLNPFRRQPVEVERQDPLLSLDAYIDMLSSFSYQGLRYTMPGAKAEEIGDSFRNLSASAYQSDSVVFACMAVRMLLFKDIRFQFRQIRTGGPGALFGTQDLRPLENPWPGATTSDLLARAITDADLAGNAFFALMGSPSRVRRLRPDWVTLVIGSPDDSETAAWDPEADVVGYIYKPGGPGSDREAILFQANEVAHFAPIPDPTAQYRGMSWLTPVVREIMADKAATEHKLKFFENSATPQMIIKLDTSDLDKYSQYIELFKAGQEAARNAYRTMFLAQGADATVVGKDLQQIDFKGTQGAGETRIAAAASVPPVLVGLSEGLASATYSNYGMARRRFADGTMRPLWRDFCGSMARIINVPAGAELWYDDRDVAFLKEDQLDAAEIQAQKSHTIVALVNAGFEPDTVIDAVEADDYSRLVHTGLLSVQLQPPGTTLPGSNGAPPSLSSPIPRRPKQLAPGNGSAPAKTP